jgi:hypothetical protein
MNMINTQTNFDVNTLLFPGEEIETTVWNIQIICTLVTQALPIADWNFGPLSGGTYNGFVTLTSKKLILGMYDKNNIWRYVYLPHINYISERLLTEKHSDWPYQAMVNVPGGMVIVVQNIKADKNEAKLLSALLQKSVRILGSKNDDDSSQVIIEEVRRQSEKSHSDDSYYSKDKKE